MRKTKAEIKAERLESEIAEARQELQELQTFKREMVSKVAKSRLEEISAQRTPEAVEEYLDTKLTVENFGDNLEDFIGRDPLRDLWGGELRLAMLARGEFENLSARDYALLGVDWRFSDKENSLKMQIALKEKTLRFGQSPLEQDSIFDEE